MTVYDQAKREMDRLTEQLKSLQQADGSWRMCAESGPMTEAYMIVLLRALQRDDEPLIALLSERLLKRQLPSGAWRLYEDEPEGGNVSATAEAYFALLYSGTWKPGDEAAQAAKRYVLSRGGLARTGLMTKVMFALNGQYPWRNHFLLPIEFLLMPEAFPLHFFDLSGYARVHIVPVMVAGQRKFSIVHANTPSLAELKTNSRRQGGSASTGDRSPLKDLLGSALKKLHPLPYQLESKALKKAEAFMLERIEPDGTLYSYFSSTVLMIYALLSLGYDKRHPRIMQAVEGLKSYVCRAADGTMHMQNFTSTVWDTSLVAHALQEAGASAADPVIQRAGAYILSRQQSKTGDWARHAPHTAPGGWGFSDVNTINPDIDDTAAALRAIRRLVRDGGVGHLEAWNRGLNWLLSMQNDDGGWAAFEKNVDMKILTWLPVENAADALIDPSCADLTGRALEFLGRSAGLRRGIPLIDRAVDWLLSEQVRDGSWYGRWGVCYLYGTWAAVTGLMAVGTPAEHPAVLRAVRWLRGVQHADGGFGESCRSDVERRYVPLGFSTPSQTAWALDALLAAQGGVTPEAERAADRLAAFGASGEDERALMYPTGAGLPGGFYLHYHSYRRVWPLLALAKYVKAAGT